MTRLWLPIVCALLLLLLLLLLYILVVRTYWHGNAACGRCPAAARSGGGNPCAHFGCMQVL